MQYIALDAAMIIPGDRDNRLVSAAQFGNGDDAPPACILHTRLYDATGARQLDFGSAETELADYDNLSGLTGWKRLLAWTGAAAASWAIVIGLVAIARALLS